MVARTVHVYVVTFATGLTVFDTQPPDIATAFKVGTHVATPAGEAAPDGPVTDAVKVTFEPKATVGAFAETATSGVARPAVDVVGFGVAMIWM